jgi:hypothetical protein
MTKITLGIVVDEKDNTLMNDAIRVVADLNILLQRVDGIKVRYYVERVVEEN